MLRFEMTTVTGLVEIAAITFLAGEKAAFITVQTLFVDGGASLRTL
jgi:hypothetical protein